MRHYSLLFLSKFNDKILDIAVLHRILITIQHIDSGWNLIYFGLWEYQVFG